MNAIWDAAIWQLVVATVVLGLALAASWLPLLAARTRHLVLVGGLLLAVAPARGWLEAVRLLGLDPAAHRGSLPEPQRQAGAQTQSTLAT